LRHLVSTRKESVCASWDYVQKAWSTADCEVIKTNQTHTSCKCQRLANYAILNVDQATINEAIKEEKMALPASEDGNLAVIVSITVVAVCLFILLLTLLVVRHTDLKPRLDKFIHSKKACFSCKKSESQTSSGSGLYPALTSSPTSTTVSAGTPTTMNASSNYLVQILEQQAETMKHVKANKAMPQVRNQGGIYQVTAPRNHGSMQQQNPNVFRPVSPYNHHIYMEIDPVYQQHLMNVQQQQQDLSENGNHSDIQLSDISDDDLKRFSDARNARYAEERPLIRTAVNPDQHFNRHCMTTHRASQLQNGVTLRPVTMNFNHHSLRYGVPPGNQSLRPQQREAPITIALQGGDQFVSLAIDKEHGSMYAPVHH